MIDGLRILPTIVFLSLFPWRTCRRIKATWDAKLHVCISVLPGKRRFLSLHAIDIRHGQQSTSKVDEVDIIPRFWLTTPAAVHAKIGLKWMTNILQLAIKGNELTNQTKRYLMDDTWQLFSTKNWWARGLLSVPKKLGTISRSNGTWNVGFRGEGKPQIPGNNLSQQRLKNHQQNLNEDSTTQVILIWREASAFNAVPSLFTYLLNTMVFLSLGNQTESSTSCVRYMVLTRPPL